MLCKNTRAMTRALLSLSTAAVFGITAYESEAYAIAALEPPATLSCKEVFASYAPGGVVGSCVVAVFCGSTFVHNYYDSFGNGTTNTNGVGIGWCNSEQTGCNTTLKTLTSTECDPGDPATIF
jgi:hypothetical protein